MVLFREVIFPAFSKLLQIMAGVNFCVNLIGLSRQLELKPVRLLKTCSLIQVKKESML